LVWKGSGRVDLHDFNYSPAAFLLFDLDQHCRTGRDANITRRLEHRDVQKGIANTFKFNETELLVQFEPAYSTARNHARFPIWTAPTRLRLGSFNERRQIRNRPKAVSDGCVYRNLIRIDEVRESPNVGAK